MSINKVTEEMHSVKEVLVFGLIVSVSHNEVKD